MDHMFYMSYVLSLTGPWPGHGGRAVPCHARPATKFWPARPWCPLGDTGPTRDLAVLDPGERPIYFKKKIIKH